MRNVLVLSAGEDTGGIGIALKRAFDRWAPEWSARAVRRANNYIDYPADIEWSGEFPNAEVDELYRNADVLHVMERPDILTELGPTSAKVIVHHLGSYYRSDPEGVSAQCQAIGAVEVAGSFDLMLLPHLTFLPIAAPDLDDLAEYRKAYRPRRLRIAHAPTNREVKSTEAILAAIKRLGWRYRVVFDLIEQQSWVCCLELKAKADIYVDETTYGYGLNAIECWAMGIPVISGIADPKVRDLMIAEWGGLPFYETTEASLEQSLVALIEDHDLRAEWGDRGRQHVLKIHSPQAVVAKTLELYQGVAQRAA